ncbi:WD repeat and HMG-box DNA-binding protein 1 [Quillaja saponaria]|uniref:WD repeat and HMG-box DNA-binding protein 1 n=1 Tax=Quillaja saponaria TaxID=32244 RepID=A0AAD7QC53_QUISA|nr:WD repeat and HMG-box DNA-binding protein 1 [Quillaja saponaria]
MPLRSLAFNKSRSMLAAAGDDKGIKLINTIDGSIARVLKGNRGRIRHNLKSIAPDISDDLFAMNIIRWSPDGEILAVSGLRNHVVMYDRDAAEKLFSFRGDHMQHVCFLCWSPNGKYMATSGLDKQVLIWDIDQKQDIDRQKFDERICCMAWKPIGNALAIIDVMGKYGIWESLIPSSMRSPTEDIPSLQSKNSNGLLFFDEENQDLKASGSLSDLSEVALMSLNRLVGKDYAKRIHLMKTLMKMVVTNSACFPRLNPSNISNGSQPIQGRFPLTPGSYLKWFGFSEEGQWSSYDSKGVVRVFTSQYGGSRLPLFNASKEKKSDENYWVVGLNASKLFCIISKNHDLFPQFSLYLIFHFQWPLDLGAEALENEIIMKSMHLSQIQKRMEEMANSGDKLARATEFVFVKLLSLEKSVEGTIKLVTDLKLPNLAERFSSILEERLLSETTTLPNNCPVSIFTTDVAVSKSKALTSHEAETVSLLSSPALTAPPFIKKAKTQEVAKLEREKTERNQVAVADERV